MLNKGMLYVLAIFIQHEWLNSYINCMFIISLSEILECI